MNLNVTETVEGYPIKDLRLIPLDNIITGFVRCPIYSKPNLHEGWVTIQWNVKGFPIKKYKGMPEYKINLEIPN